MNRLTSLAAAVLLTGGMAEAGFVSPGTNPDEGRSFATDMGDTAARHRRWNIPSRRLAAIAIDHSGSSPPATNVAPGGMSSPTDAGARSASNSLVLPELHSAAAATVSWLVAEDRSSVPLALRAGIFRPPRWIAR